AMKRTIAKPATRRRMRRARRRIDASLLLATDRAFTSAGVRYEGDWRPDASRVSIVSPIEWLAFDAVSTPYVGVPWRHPERMLSSRATGSFSGHHPPPGGGT